MGKIGKGKALASVSLPHAWRDEIDRRANALNLTRATYLRMMVADWRKRGSPPLSDADRFMQIAQKTPPAKEKR